MTNTKTMTRQDEQGYNGWTNYETWAVKLWIDNEQADQEYWLKQARGEDTGKLSRRLKDTLEDNSPLIDQATLYTDLLNSALDRVNWYEIAQALKEDAEEVL